MQSTTAVFLFVIASTAFSVFANAAAPPGPPVTCNIALLGAFSGENRAYGTILHNVSLMFAPKALSKYNIVMNYTEFDTQCSETYSVPIMKNITKNGTSGFVGVVGDTCSDSTLAIAPIANAANLPMISPSSTSPLLTTNGGKCFFRTCPSDVNQGKSFAQLVSGQKNSKIAIVFGAGESYGEGIFHELAKNINSGLYNSSLVAAVGFDSTQPWVNGTVAGILKSGATAVIFAANNPVACGDAAVELRALGYKGKFYATDSLAGSPDLLKNPYYTAMKDMIANTLYIGQGAFLEEWKSTYGVLPPNSAAEVYDALTAYAMTCATFKPRYKGKPNSGKEVCALLSNPRFNITDAATGWVAFDKPFSGDNLKVAYSLVQLTAQGWV